MHRRLHSQLIPGIWCKTNLIHHKQKCWVNYSRIFFSNELSAIEWIFIFSVPLDMSTIEDLFHWAFRNAVWDLLLCREYLGCCLGMWPETSHRHYCTGHRLRSWAVIWPPMKHIQEAYCQKYVMFLSSLVVIECFVQCILEHLLKMFHPSGFISGNCSPDCFPSPVIQLMLCGTDLDAQVTRQNIEESQCCSRLGRDSSIWNL